MDGPTATPDGLSEFGLAEGCASIQFIKELSSRLEQLMDPFHLVVPTEIAKALSLKGDGVVIEESLQSYAFDIQDPAKKLQHLNHFPGQAQTPFDLAGKKTRRHGPLFLRQISRGPPEERIPSLLIHMGVELRGVRIIDDEKVPFDLSQVDGICKLKRVKGVPGARKLDLYETGSVSLRTEKACHLFPANIAEGNGIDPKAAIEGWGNENPVETFFFRAIEPVDSVNPGHRAPSLEKLCDLWSQLHRSIEIAFAEQSR